MILNCLKDNYKEINGYIKVIKEEKQFKNCKFFYIGIQEVKEPEIDEDILFEKKNKKIINFDELKVKLYTFSNGKIFGEDYRTMNKKKIETLNIIKPEFDNIDKKFENIDKRLKYLEVNTLKINKSLEILIENQKKSYSIY